MPRPASRCFACGARGLMPFHEQRGVPVSSSLLLASRAEALSYPRGDLRLAFCGKCGFIQNQLFDNRNEHTAEYDDVGGNSPRLSQHIDSLTDSLIERYDLRGKAVLELGCGSGNFLSELCRKGGNHGTRVSPISLPVPENGFSIDQIAGSYSESHLGLKADLVCSRHTLEHIQPTGSFIDLVRRGVGNNHEPVVFFEVPDVRRSLIEVAFWDTYYDHCSYFSAGSLARLFRANDFDIFDLRRVFEDQNLQIEAVASTGTPEPGWEAEEDIEELRHLVAYFRDTCATRVQKHDRWLTKLRAEGRKAVLWGSGARASGYLTNLEAADAIEFVVDINISRHGKYLAGTGHEVIPPEFLRDYRPDVVITLNSVYRDEIAGELDRLGLEAELVAI